MAWHETPEIVDGLGWFDPAALSGFCGLARPAPSSTALYTDLFSDAQHGRVPLPLARILVRRQMRRVADPV